jgi:hypothetical protein
MSGFLNKFPVGERISYEDWGGYRETGTVIDHRRSELNDIKKKDIYE